MALPLHNPEKISSKRGWIVPSIYQPLMFSNRYLQALEAQARDPESPGHSDVGIKNLLFMLIMSMKPDSILEIGGHIGTAAIVMGEALRINGFGKLLSLEPQDHYFKRLSEYIRLAELESFVEPIKGFSYEKEVRVRVGKAAPFELIFLDACHDYDVVLSEIREYSELLSENGIMVLHDTSTHAQSFDSTGKGGVRKAILDSVGSCGTLKHVLFEYPLWLNNCGAGLLVKQSFERSATTSLFNKILKLAVP